MLTIGAKPDQMGAMQIDHIFLSRLRLLIIMLKGYLKGYPIGRYRLEGVIRNARIIGDEVVDLWHLIQRVDDNTSARAEFDKDREIYEHIKMLALLAEKIEPDTKPDISTTESVSFHLEHLNRNLLLNQSLSEMQFLKVA